MSRTRVLLAVPVEMRAGVEQSLAGADDIEVVGAAAGPIEILMAAGDLRPHVVVVRLSGDEVPGFASHLLAEHPQLKVLGITPSRERAAVYELEPHLVLLGDVSDVGLLGAIRLAMRMDVG